MSTMCQGFSHFSGFLASFCTCQISHEQYKGLKYVTFIVGAIGPGIVGLWYIAALVAGVSLDGPLLTRLHSYQGRLLTVAIMAETKTTYLYQKIRR